MGTIGPNGGDFVDSSWKASALVPMMLLNKPIGGGSVGRDELAFRADKFSRGEWGTLVDEAKWSRPRRGETSTMLWPSSNDEGWPHRVAWSEAKCLGGCSILASLIWANFWWSKKV